MRKTRYQRFFGILSQHPPSKYFVSSQLLAAHPGLVSVLYRLGARAEMRTDTHTEGSLGKIPVEESLLLASQRELVLG